MWTRTARQHISPELTTEGVKKCCISSAVHETDDGILWNVWAEREGDERTDCEDGQSDTDW